MKFWMIYAPLVFYDTRNQNSGNNKITIKFLKDLSLRVNVKLKIHTQHEWWEEFDHIPDCFLLYSTHHGIQHSNLTVLRAYLKTRYNKKKNKEKTFNFITLRELRLGMLISSYYFWKDLEIRPTSPSDRFYN